MAKEKEQTEAQQTAQQPATSTTPNYDKWRSNMQAKYPDAKDDEALYEASMRGYDEEHDFAKNQRAENQQIADLIGANPQLASFYSEMLERGKDGHPEMAILNLGDLITAYATGELSSDEYIAEKEKRSAAAKEKESKMDAQNAVFKDWCEKKGYDPEEWAKKAADALFNPMANYEMAEAQFDAIDNMLNYNEDVEAAEVRGRNAKITAQRKKNAGATDGMINGTSASGSVPAQKRSRNIFDYAEAAQ